MISLERAQEIFSYNPDTGDLFYCATGQKAGIPNHEGYLRVFVDGSDYRVYRIAWFITYGEWPKTIDHINGIVDDDRLENLRSVTNQENLKNTKMYSHNTSGIMGVYKTPSGSYRASINVDGKTIALGTYGNKRMAAEVRKKAENKHGFHENHGRVT